VLRVLRKHNGFNVKKMALTLSEWVLADIIVQVSPL